MDMCIIPPGDGGAVNSGFSGGPFGNRVFHLVRNMPRLFHSPYSFQHREMVHELYPQVYSEDKHGCMLL